MKIKTDTHYIIEELATIIVLREVNENGLEGNAFSIKIEDQDCSDFIEELKNLIKKLEKGL